LAASAARASSDVAAVSRDDVFIPDCGLRPSDIVYLRLFRNPARSRPPPAAASRTADPVASVKGTAGPFSAFGCFGFFCSRFDRLCSFAMVAFLIEVPAPFMSSAQAERSLHDMANFAKAVPNHDPRSDGLITIPAFRVRGERKRASTR
jgi:hypothetical protein